jgi:glycine/D-amino acid oxidase-like deaminating enzyme
VVVGGGVVGLLTALECAHAGMDVTLVDQADALPYVWATSNDRHRIVRAFHRGDGATTRAAAAAHRRWIELEGLLGLRFYHRVGALTVLPAGLPAGEVTAGVAMLAAAGIPAVGLAAGELAERYPQVAFAPGSAGVLETGTGVVLADRALPALVGALRWHPRVRLCLRRRVVAVEAGGAGGRLVRLADGAVLRADRVVIAAGPWSAALLPADVSVRLTLNRQSMLYCRVPDDLLGGWSAAPAMPSLGTADGAWLVPPVAGTPLKLSAGQASRAVAALTDHVTPPRWRGGLVDAIGPRIAGFDPAWVSDARDFYYFADTVTGGPLLARSGDEAVWAYAACGGISFKFAPLIARVLTERLCGADPAPTGFRPLDQPCVMSEPYHTEPFHTARGLP